MKPIFPSTPEVKRLTSLWLVLVIVVFLRQTNPASALINQMTSHELYLEAFNYANDQDHIHAAIYLFAYVQKNPPEYANNINGHKTAVDFYLEDLLEKTRKEADLLKEVETELRKCGKFPCDQSTVDITFMKPGGPLSAPPDAVIVCTKPRYQGTCNMLFAGDFVTQRSLEQLSDSIGSVMVGSRVKITLFTEVVGDPHMITLTRGDSDLSNNLTSDGDRLNRVISTGSVEWR